MPTAVQEQPLTLEEFHARYDGEKPCYEYWNGEAVQKAMATGLHGKIQKISMFLLDKIGLESGSEVTLKIDPAYELIPDVIADERGLKDGYPTAAVDVAIEILSPGDSFSRVMQKCRLYEQWGIRRILVIDPDDRIVWSFEKGAPGETDLIARHGDRSVTARELWHEVDRQLA